MASYRVLLYAKAADFSVGDLVEEVEHPKYLAWAVYLSDIGEAFFTMSQYDPKTTAFRANEGTGHIFIIRDDGVEETVVWRGIVAEHDAIDEDVIFYCYGYEHFLFSLHSQWKKTWKNVRICGNTTGNYTAGNPIDDMWTRAKSFVKSPLQWVADGSFHSPWVDDAHSAALVLNKYTVNWKPILTIFRELTAIGLSDTSQIIRWQIHYSRLATSKAATFSYVIDSDYVEPNLIMDYPGNILDWSDRFIPVMLRNKTLGVGTGPRGQLYRFVKKVSGGTYGAASFGLRQQNMYLSWVRDRAELKRVVRRRTRLALRSDTNVWIRAYPDTMTPTHVGSLEHLGSLAKVNIDTGATVISANLLCVGEQVIWVNGREYVQPMLEDRGATE